MFSKSKKHVAQGYQQTQPMLNMPYAPLGVYQPQPLMPYGPQGLHEMFLIQGWFGCRQRVSSHIEAQRLVPVITPCVSIGWRQALAQHVGTKPASFSYFSPEVQQQQQRDHLQMTSRRRMFRPHR
jgi:hypothetical protein